MDLRKLTDDTLGADFVRSLRQRLQLPEPVPPFGEVPAVNLIMLFTSRSGSTYAARLLANTAHFGAVREAFNPATLKFNRQRHCLSDDAAAARWAVDRWRSDQAFGAKCGLPGIVGALHTGFLEAAWARTQFIVLRRRDTVLQAISLVKANMSGQFHSTASAKRELQVEDYDRAAISQAMATIEKAEQRLLHFAAALPKDVPGFWYEDICEAPRDFVHAVCKTIDLDIDASPSTEVDVAKMHDSLSDDWSRRYRQGR